MTASQQPSKPIDANWNLVQVLQLDNPETSGWTCKGRTQSGRRCRRLLTLANRNAIEAILPKISSTPAVDETRELNLLTRCCLCYGHDDDATAETVALQWAKDLESARSGNAAEQTDSLASGAVRRQQRFAGKKNPATTEEQEQANTQSKDKLDEEADAANPVSGPRRSSSSSPDLPSPPKLSLPVRTLRQTSQPSMSPPNQQQDRAGLKISGEIDPHSHDCDDQDDNEEEEEAENEGTEEEDDEDEDDQKASEDEEYDMENEDEKAKAEKEHTKAEDEDGDEQDDEEEDDDDDDEQDVEVDDKEDEEEEDAAEEEDGYESDEEDTGQEGEDDDRTATEKAEHGTGKKADIDAEEEGDDVEEEEEEDSDIGYEDYVEGEEEDEEDEEEDPEIDTRSKATTGILHTKKLEEAPLGEVLRRSGRQRSEPVDSLGGMSLR